MGIVALRANVKAQGLGRTLGYGLKSRGVHPAVARVTTHILKRVFSPREMLARRYPHNGIIDRSRGYAAATLPNTAPLIEHCRKLLAIKRAALMADFKPPYAWVTRISRQPSGPFIDNIGEMEPIIRFCEQPEILNIAAGYLGEIPVISTVTPVFTAPHGGELVKSQMWHRDMNHWNQVHMLVAIDDVTDGAFTIVPAQESAAITKAIGYERGRVPDDVFASATKVACEGPAGSAWFVDPYACFHMGGRARQRSRFVLIINFTSIAEGAEGLEALYRATNRWELENGNPIRRLLLNLH